MEDVITKDDQGDDQLLEILRQFRTTEAIGNRGQTKSTALKTKVPSKMSHVTEEIASCPGSGSFPDTAAITRLTTVSSFFIENYGQIRRC